MRLSRNRCIVASRSAAKFICAILPDEIAFTDETEKDPTKTHRAVRLRPLSKIRELVRAKKFWVRRETIASSGAFNTRAEGRRAREPRPVWNWLAPRMISSSVYPLQVYRVYFRVDDSSRNRDDGSGGGVCI